MEYTNYIYEALQKAMSVARIAKDYYGTQPKQAFELIMNVLASIIEILNPERGIVSLAEVAERYNSTETETPLILSKDIAVQDRGIAKLEYQKALITMKAIEVFSSQFADPMEPKKYYLRPVKNKKLGIVYYVRYLNNGQLVNSNWCTHTNNKDAAEQCAVENRDRLLNQYFNRDNVKKPYGDMYSILKKYYAKGSKYLQIDIDRGKSISEKVRGAYHNFITKQFIPYLRKNGITDFEQIDVPLLAKFQNYLLAPTNTRPGVKPQTIKIYLLTISNIFNHLLIQGHVKTNPYKSLPKLKIRDEQLRGCYEISALKGVFNETWKNRIHYLLCMVIYTTGMRNSEIERMRVKDLTDVDGVWFVNITESKTRNGIRLVPLHNFVYRKIMAYVKKTGKTENDLIFKAENTVKIMSKTYERANAALADFTKYTPEMLQQENITFYSGRHFWKTLMDAEKLGDIEEYFMGHKTGGNVAKRYNHKDKQGKTKLLERVKRVFQILEKYIFNEDTLSIPEPENQCSPEIRGC
ncbi:MAG: tyrosine-type recombinase/integrase [Treponema sp.]|nr:tyrosine-type recombinase/integrase [Treponema sp.]